MADCSDRRSSLPRGGTSQGERGSPALLDPDYVAISGEGYADWIVFAAKFSGHLKFFDSATGAITGDWRPFFTRDVSATIAGIAVADVDGYRAEVKQRMDLLKSNTSASTADRETALTELISAILTLSLALDEKLGQLDAAPEFARLIDNAIRVKLAPALARLIRYYEAAKGLSLTAKTLAAWRILELPLQAPDGFDYPTRLSARWWTASPDLSADPSIFGVDPDPVARMRHAVNHFLWSSIFDQYVENFARIVQEAETALATSLASGDHAPHYALFLAFLQLLRTAQKGLNGLTQRHLDYYYKEVLRLKPRPALPGQAHLLAALQKNVATAALKAGTAFKAGKDGAGKEALFALDRDTTFNRAGVSLFKAVYVDDTQLLAGPIMNSADGAGAPLTEEPKAWHPFASADIDEQGTVSAMRMPAGRMGFAVASHHLFLSEGERTIRLRLGLPESELDITERAKQQKDNDKKRKPKQTKSTAVKILKSLGLECRVTAQKKWLAISPPKITSALFSNGAPCVEITLTVPGTLPAITAHDPKIHGATYRVDVPIVECVMTAESSRFSAAMQLAVSAVEIDVQVGTYDETSAGGAKALLLSNQLGPLDASKPFQPWGSVPVGDCVFVVGYKELFEKENASFLLNVEWANRPTSIPYSPGAFLEFLQGGTWQSASSVKNICQASSPALFSATDVPAKARVDYTDDYGPFNAGAQGGFMRIVLGGSFGQDAYPQKYAAYLINLGKAVPDPTVTEPPTPYLPVIKSISLTYTAHTGPVDLTTAPSTTENPSIRIFHIGPFGEAERQGSSSGAEPFPLFPKFTSSKHEDNLAECYLGFSKLSPGEGVNVLFGLLEGSAAPLLAKPKQHIEWSYLSANEWKFFDAQQVIDGTRQLLQTGIVSFAVPLDATAENTWLPAGYVWLRASVAEAVGAVCKVVGVDAQGLLATYAPDGNASDFLDRPLPAGTIAKLKEPDARFKSFRQPYASFGGRPAEQDGAFHVRVSERLRHKGRAVTAWDYEHLVLEAFPELYRAKCLNHTQVEDAPDLAVYKENKPGYVTIVTVPDLRNLAGANPLKPFTSQALLDRVKDFLAERTSSQVRVSACNPAFEEISVSFKLSLVPGVTDFAYYSAQLQREITRFLSPWAYDGAADVEFGGSIAKSSLIDFIEDRDYVDFITDVVMKQKIHRPGSAPELSDDLEEAGATTARSILVSVPPDQHGIAPYATT